MSRFSYHKHQRNFLHSGGLLLVFFSIILVFSCDKKEVLEPEEPHLPALTDPIPYESLGSGTIVFQRIGPYPGEYEGCYVIDVSSRETWSFDFGLADNFCVSPDGQKIAFTKYSGTHSAYDVYVINTDGTGLVRLDNLPGQDRYPTWSPNGNQIFFWVEGGGEPTLYVVKKISPTPENPEKIKTFSEHPPSGRFSVSSDGKIAYLSNMYWQGHTVTGLYVMDEHGSNAHLIVTKPDDRIFESPVFSKDGQTLYYLSVEQDSTFTYHGVDIMAVSIDGSN